MNSIEVTNDEASMIAPTISAIAAALFSEITSNEFDSMDDAEKAACVALLRVARNILRKLPQAPPDHACESLEFRRDIENPPEKRRQSADEIAADDAGVPAVGPI